MRIDSYSVQMNTQHFKLDLTSTKSSIQQDEKTFEKKDELSVSDFKIDAQKTDDNKKLSVELSKAVLQNINAESRRVLNDRIEISTTSIEAQGLNFSVSAKVIADGKEMDISLDLTLSRSFIQKTQMSVSLATESLKDPLVISLDGAMPSLSSNTFSFDIDSDGESDQISLLQRGSGFLALDKNNNNKIDDGSELFGTKSGDGFGDLSKYDDDKNGWIDANDKIFDKLRIWTKTDTKNELLGLGEVGIGALFLGNTETPFSIKSESNTLLGEMRKSGMVLFESGRAGVISHIDMAVETKDKLNVFETLKKDLSFFETTKTYANNQKNELKNGDEDDILTQLQKRIRILEAKLSHASSSEKGNIQTQINLLQTQIMSFLG